MPKGTEDRRVGRALPSPVIPVSNICFRITIPDAVPYRAALVGSLAELTQWYAWDHPRGVNDCPDCEEAAQLWSAALAGSTYTEECEDTLSCEEIISCIETNPATRQAVIDALLDSPDMLQYITNNTNGITLTGNQGNQNLLKPEQCDPDFVFNQASTVIQLLHDLTEDIFEAVEVGTNALERAEFLINIIGVGTRAMVIDTILEWADTLIENVQEEYAGAYDASLFDELRCELFCRVKDSCVMTIDDIHEFYSDKFSLSLPSNLFDALNAIANFQVTGDFPGDTVVYSMHLLIILLIKAGDSVLGINFSKLGLRVIAAGATGDPSWETLCEDCTEFPSARLEVYGGWDEDQLEFIENLDTDTSVWRIHRRFAGGYATGAFRSVGAIPFYILNSTVISGTYWQVVGTGSGNEVQSGIYALEDIPCYLPTTFINLYGIGQTVTDEVAEITVSRVPCPIWEPYSTWAVINEQDATSVHATGVDIGGGALRLGIKTVGGLVFNVDTILYDPTKVGFASYFNAAGVEVSGIPTPGMNIQGFYFGITEIIDVTLTGEVVS
jgi:hypothetical protein